MKALILTVSALLIFFSYATAREFVAGQGQQLSGPAVKLAMGPTSAPQKQGGTGEGAPPDSSKPHKKLKHKHQT